MNTQLLADVPLGTISTGDVGLTGDPVDTIASTVSTAIGLMTVVAAVYFTFNIITSATSIITSAGDKGNLEQARTKMTHSLIGLVATISALFIIDMLSTVLGFPKILDFGAMIGGL